MFQITLYCFVFFFCHSMNMHRSMTLLGLFLDIQKSENKVIYFLWIYFRLENRAIGSQTAEEKSMLKNECMKFNFQTI